MQIYDAKLKRKVTVFKDYKIGEANSCPECHRPFKEGDIKFLELNEFLRCPKCNARLTR